MLKGIDISTFQKQVDYSKLKEQGIEFAIIRCGYGKDSSQKDAMFETHYKGLKEAGIKVGAYLYSYCSNVNNAVLEARNCLEFIKGKQFELPIFYDLEDKITKVLGRVAITQIAINFCEEIEKAGYKAGIYANLDWFKNYIDIPKVSQYKIWLAQWNVEKPTPKFKYNYWQYTSHGHIDGIVGSVDMNYCYDEISENVENVENNVEKSKYKIGNTYTLQVDLYVRVGAGTNNKIKNYNELTEDGKKHAYNQSNAVLKKGTRVTCLEEIKLNNEIWLRIPSGYIAGFYNNKEYVK